MNLATIAFTFLLFINFFAFGQKQKPEPCANAQSQAEMNMCWARQYKAADAELNKVYQQFLTKLDDEEKVQLKNAQVAWLKYRDANCEFEADRFKGGSMRPGISALCLADVTNNRTSELKAQMKEREF